MEILNGFNGHYNIICSDGHQVGIYFTIPILQ